MELKFSVGEKILNNDLNNQSLQAHHGVCTVSCENIVFFTQVHYHSSSFKRSIPVYTSYVADLNSPFETHKIMESLDQITQACFDCTGQYLLVVTSLGNVYLYAKGCCLHQWSNTHTSDWSGEEILFADFFHSKNKPCIQLTDIKLSAPYSEKFHCKPHQQSLKTIGNSSQNGFFAVTASGLILACTVSSSGILEEESKAVLGPIRDNFIYATASLAPSGRIHIAAWKPEIIKCWEIGLTFIERERIASKEGKILGGFSINGNRKLKISVQSTQSFAPLPAAADSSLSNVPINRTLNQHVKVTNLKYTDHEDPSSLLILLEVRKGVETTKSEQSPGPVIKPDEEFPASYILQRYQLIEKTRVFHKLFQDLSTSKETSVSSTTIKEWVCQAEWISNVQILGLCSPTRFLFPGSSIPYAIAVSTVDGTVYSINRETMQTMNKYCFQSNRNDEMPSPKRVKTSKQLISLAPTWTNLHLLALDSQGGLHFLSLLKQSDVGSSWAISVMLLLEYSLVTNCDCWDILMVTPPNSIVTLSEKLTDNFNQHPSPIISNLLSKFLVLKNTMLRFSGNLHQRSMEAKLQAQLATILKLFHSLRPVTSDVMSIDKNISSHIQGYIEGRNSLEIPELDKSVDHFVLYNCNILDCQVDPSLAKDLQILLQFSTDLALYLLLLLVQNPKYELAKETKILLFLREILFTSRLWYRHNKLVIPQMIKKSDSVDIWAQLYKLLTRLASIIPNEPDTGFLDDCIILETQVVCREVPLFIPPRGVMGCLSSSTPSCPIYPIQFTNGQGDPNPLASSVSPRPLEGSLSPPQPLDSLSYQFLGSNAPILQCTRCFAVRGSWWGVKQVSMWEQEWANRCICSGHWAPSYSEHSTRIGSESG